MASCARCVPSDKFTLTKNLHTPINIRGQQSCVGQLFVGFVFTCTCAALLWCGCRLCLVVSQPRLTRRGTVTSNALRGFAVSIEPYVYYLKLRGYMSIKTKDTEFTESQEGLISSNKWHGG